LLLNYVEARIVAEDAVVVVVYLRGHCGYCDIAVIRNMQITGFLRLTYDNYDYYEYEQLQPTVLEWL
jgi:hypothetical protein